MVRLIPDAATLIWSCTIGKVLPWRRGRAEVHRIANACVLYQTYIRARPILIGLF